MIEETKTPTHEVGPKGLYKQLVQTAKSLGFKKIGKGKPSVSELNNFIYKNIDVVKPKLPKQKRKYDSSYYYELFFLAVCNGFVNDRAGKQKLNTLIDFLTNRGIELPENKVVINQKRKSFSECRTYYDKLLFEAKQLGYSQNHMGLPSLKDLEKYLRI